MQNALRDVVRGYGVRPALWCLLAASACSSNPDDDSDASSRTDDTDGATEAGGALYAVSANTFSLDFSNTTSLLWLVGDLGSGSVDGANAIELAGGATVWGVPESGAFYVVSAESLTISKYRLVAGAPMATGERIGLTNTGITSLYTPQMIFDGPSRAFFLDIVSAQALELDLDAMSITRSLDLSSVVFDSSQISNFGAQFLRRGDRYVNTVIATSPTFDRVNDTSNVLFFDPRDGSFETKEVACGGLQYLAEASNGDLFISSDTYAASVHLVDPDNNPAPCMVRLPAGSDDPDTSVIRLNDLTGGLPTGGLIAGPDNTAFLRALDTQSYSLPTGANYAVPFSAAAWQTYRIHLDAPSSAERTDRPLLAGGIKTFPVDGEIYENESEADFSSTTLIRTTGNDAPAPGLTMPGVIWGIVRVR
jgi:hypothetical protein